MKHWILANSMILRLAVGLAITCAAVATVLLAEWVRERFVARESHGPTTAPNRLELSGTKTSSGGVDPRSPASRDAANDSEPRAA